jgi:hypothetical protein
LALRDWDLPAQAALALATHSNKAAHSNSSSMLCSNMQHQHQAQAGAVHTMGLPGRWQLQDYLHNPSFLLQPRPPWLLSKLRSSSSS